MQSKTFFINLIVISAIFLSLGGPVQSANGAQPDKERVLDLFENQNTFSDLVEDGMQINEVMFFPEAGQHEWVEIKNTSSASISIRGYSLTDEDDNWFRFPDALPDVPAGAFVVVIFDGAGETSNDYDFNDNVATLHSNDGLVNIFEDDMDQVSLYPYSSLIYLPVIQIGGTTSLKTTSDIAFTISEPQISSFVAWGSEPGEDATNASLAGLWDLSWFVNIYHGTGFVDTDAFAAQGETIGVLPGGINQTPDDWEIYLSPQKSPGEENSSPMISWYYPDDGALIDGGTFSISWNAVNGAVSYQFQIDESVDFETPIFETKLLEPVFIPIGPVADGVYYWRVKVFLETEESPWTQPISVQTITMPDLVVTGTNIINETIARKSLPITWQLQHKDTNMLCLDGDAEIGGNAWDRPHTSRGEHGNMYCARATLTMMASYYGGELSQDRISYQIFGGGQPEGDLGHNVGVSLEQIDQSINWALGMSIQRQDGKPTFQQIKGWIDADRPIYSVIRGHARLIVGYHEFSSNIGTIQFLHLLDPWDREKWVDYDSDNILYVWVGPEGTGGAPAVRSDENDDGDGILDTMDDTDGDGICDFDERNRTETSYSSIDYDGDQISDKLDMREYLFNNDGTFNHRRADFDFDELRKELDPDNDRPTWFAGTHDGCEDANRMAITNPNWKKPATLIHYMKENAAASPRAGWCTYRGGIPDGLRPRAQRRRYSAICE